MAVTSPWPLESLPPAIYVAGIEELEVTSSTISYPIKRDEFLRQMGMVNEGYILSLEDVERWVCQIWETLEVMQPNEEGDFSSLDCLVRAVLRDRELTVVFFTRTVCYYDENRDFVHAGLYGTWLIDLELWRRTWVGGDEPTDNNSDLRESLLHKYGYR